MGGSSSIVLIGRIERAPWRRVSQELIRRRLDVQRYLSKSVRWVVVGHGAVRSLRSGRLENLLAQSDRIGVRILSEASFLRELGLLPIGRTIPGTLTNFDLVRHSGLSESTIQLLTVFDLFDSSEGGYTLRDLKAAKHYAGWISDKDPTDAIISTLRIRQPKRTLVHLLELELSTVDSSRALPLGDEPVSFDEAWESGISAWEASEVQDAVKSFLQCSQMRPKDSSCLVNLAMALERVGEIDQARELLRRATILEPTRAEPWIDLAALSHGSDRIAYLHRAVHVDPSDPITQYELADELTGARRYRDALPFWEAVSRSGHELSASKRERARKSLVLCRLALAVDTRQST